MNKKFHFRKQSGITLIGLIFVLGVFAACGLVAYQLIPAISEYKSIVKLIKATAADPENAAATVSQIRANYNKRAGIDYVSAIGGDDLDIDISSRPPVIKFAYSKKIHLIDNASLLIDFEGSSQ